MSTTPTRSELGLFEWGLIRTATSISCSPFHRFPETNPDGLILLAVAENKLCWPMLRPEVERILSTVPDWVANYGPMSGQPPLRQSVAAFLQERVVKVSAEAWWKRREAWNDGTSRDSGSIISVRAVFLATSSFFAIVVVAVEMIVTISPSKPLTNR